MIVHVEWVREDRPSVPPDGKYEVPNEWADTPDHMWVYLAYVHNHNPATINEFVFSLKVIDSDYPDGVYIYDSE